MNSWHFFQWLFDHFDAQFLAAVLQYSTQLATALRTPMLVAITLWLAGTAAIDLYHPGTEPMFGFFRRIIRAVIVLLALTAANYNEIAGTFILTTLPNEITAAISGATNNGTLAPGAFDILAGTAWASAMQVYHNVSGWSAKAFGMVVILGFYVVASALAIGIAFFIFIAAHILLGLTIAVGPLLVCMLLWQRTVRFFDGWIAVCFALILTQIMIVTLLSLLINVETQVVHEIAGLNGTAGINASDEFAQLHYLVEGFLLFFAIGYFAKILPGHAQSIAGAVAAEVGPLTSMAHGTLSASGRAVASAANAIPGRGGGSGAAGMRSTQPAGRAP